MKGIISEFDGWCGKITPTSGINKAPWHFSKSDFKGDQIWVGLTVEFMPDMLNKRGPRAIKISKAW